jgi:hypothetical protein
MESIMDTGHLIDVAIAIFLGYMAWKLRTVEKMATDIAVIRSVLDGLPIPTMQEEIQRNRHKIADVDRGLATLGERVKSIESRCTLLHHDGIL